MMTRRDPSHTCNPLIDLPAAQDLHSLLHTSPEVQARLCQLLRELGAQADAQAEHCWRKHKPPMAAYWKAVAVYARHAARSLQVHEHKRAPGLNSEPDELHAPRPNEKGIRA